MIDCLDVAVREACESCGNDPGRMMDIVRAVQARFGHVPSAAMDLIAERTNTHRVEVESVVTFYAFLSKAPKGQIVIRLCNDVIDEMAGMGRVADVFSEELGIPFGATTPDGVFTLEYAPCIGMSDQAPAALVNDVVVTRLSGDSAREIVRELREHRDPRRLVKTLGDWNNAHPLVNAMVVNNVRKRGPVIFAPFQSGTALRSAAGMTPQEVIRVVNTARLRGRGGAGFPAGMKWDFTRKAEGGRRYVLCNADEGEPGTFKDRVILTECPDLLFEGMTIAGYAIGSTEGILYLRAEYAYLREYLEHILMERREAGLLGKNAGGIDGFDFDIRVQMGAGAYICGEETALISSCEGLRGDPKNRPPFPAQKGYMGQPSIVNNVETFCCAARIIQEGAGWFLALGSKGSPGTKLCSVSGDCKRPGVYEIPFGTTLAELLEMAGATDAQAVQVSGPSGQMIPPDQFTRVICYDDLATGGSIMVFGPQRDVLAVVDSFLRFFVHESCGFCTPCRVGNVLLKERIEKIRGGRGEPADLDYLEELGQTVKLMSRCGLGQTSANPVLTTLQNFRSTYASRVKPETQGFQASFDIQAALKTAEGIAGRKSAVFAG